MWLVCSTLCGWAVQHYVGGLFEIMCTCLVNILSAGERCGVTTSRVSCTAGQPLGLLVTALLLGQSWVAPGAVNRPTLLFLVQLQGDS